MSVDETWGRACVLRGNRSSVGNNCVGSRRLRNLYCMRVASAAPFEVNVSSARYIHAFSKSHASRVIKVFTYSHSEHEPSLLKHTLDSRILSTMSGADTLLSDIGTVYIQYARYDSTPLANPCKPAKRRAHYLSKVVYATSSTYNFCSSILLPYHVREGLGPCTITQVAPIHTRGVLISHYGLPQLCPRPQV